MGRVAYFTVERYSMTAQAAFAEHVAEAKRHGARPQALLDVGLFNCLLFAVSERGEGRFVRLL